MVKFNNDDIQENETLTDFASVGKVNMTRLNNSLPFYMFRMKLKNEKWLKPIKRDDKENCNGSCFDFLSKHFWMYFLDVEYENFDESLSHNDKRFFTRVCEP